jgi:hypothetical protein
MAPEHFARLEAMVGLLNIEERSVFLDLLDRVTQGISALTGELGSKPKGNISNE